MQRDGGGRLATVDLSHHCALRTEAGVGGAIRIVMQQRKGAAAGAAVTKTITRCSTAAHKEFSAGLKCETAGRGIEAENLRSHLTRIAKHGISRAVAVITRDRQRIRVLVIPRGPSRDDLPISLYRNRIKPVIFISAVGTKIGSNFAAAAKAGVEVSVAVIASENRVPAAAPGRRARSDCGDAAAPQAPSSTAA